MNTLTPPQLQPGDQVRVLALADSLAVVPESCRRIAQERLESMGLVVTIGKNALQNNTRGSVSIRDRMSDLEEALRDPKVQMVLAATGGYSSNQLLPYIDAALWRKNPTALCGYSDITALSNGLLSMGIESYSGPCFSTFGARDGFAYTQRYVQEVWMGRDPVTVQAATQWTDDDWERDQNDRTFQDNPGPVVVRAGSARGTVVGGNLCSLNLLQGTPYMPQLAGAVLLLEEDDLAGAFTPQEFERNLQSLFQVPGARRIAGMGIGRFQSGAGMSQQLLSEIIEELSLPNGIPVVGNLDFGHTMPQWTFPLGEEVMVEVTGRTVNITMRPR